MFKTYFIDVIRNHYIDFKGKATRKQFWMWYLCCFLITFAVSFVLNFIAGFCQGLQIPSAPEIKHTVTIIVAIFTNIFSIATLLPNLSISARRIRDAGLSVFLVLLMLPSYIIIIMNMLGQKASLGLNALTILCVVAIIIIWVLPSKQSQQN